MATFKFKLFIALAAISFGAGAQPQPGVSTPTNKQIFVQVPSQREQGFDTFRNTLKAAVSQKSSGGQNSIASKNKDGAVETNSFGGCDEFYDNAYECNPQDSYVFEQMTEYGGYNVLKRVVIEGHRACSITISSEWGSGTVPCDDIYNFINQQYPQNIYKASLLSDTAELIGAIGDILPYVGPVISPLLPKCAPTPPSNGITTPDQDRQTDWMVAKDSVVNAYIGNLSALRLAARVDVLYPSGWVQRFTIGHIVEPQKLATAPSNLTLIPLSNPAQGETPCKPQ